MNVCPVCGNPVKFRNTKTCSYTCRERKKFLNKIDRIQSKFKEPLKKVISDAYNSGKYLPDVAEIIGLKRNDTHGIKNIFNHFGIKRRPRGGNTRGNVIWLRNNPSKLTRFVMKILDQFKIRYEHEKPVDKYILDFAIGNIDLEIDGSIHYGKEFEEKDRKRDIKLSSIGWKVIRVYGVIKFPHRVRRKLEQLIISGQIPGGNQP